MRNRTLRLALALTATGAIVSVTAGTAQAQFRAPSRGAQIANAVGGALTGNPGYGYAPGYGYGGFGGYGSGFYGPGYGYGGYGPGFAGQSRVANDIAFATAPFRGTNGFAPYGGYGYNTAYGYGGYRAPMIANPPGVMTYGSPGVAYSTPTVTYSAPGSTYSAPSFVTTSPTPGVNNVVTTVPSAPMATQGEPVLQTSFQQQQATRGSRLGIETEPARAEDRDALKITRVQPGSPAERAGLQAGDMILQANGFLTKEPGNMTWILDNHASDGKVRLQVRKPDSQEPTPVELSL